MNVSIIICTRSRASSLKDTLASIGKAVVPDGWNVELLVVDNGSTDNTRDIVAAAPTPNVRLRYIFEPKPGQVYARNRGLMEAIGEIIIFTDDDVRVPESWIGGMCGPIVRGEVDAVAGGVTIAPHLERPWLQGMLRIWVGCTEGINPQQPDRMVGANMAFAARVLDKVPAFDPELGPGALGFDDETLFAWQLQKCGYRLRAAFDVAVEHHFDADRLTGESFVKLARKMGWSRAYVQHHWRHEPVPYPRLQVLRYFLDLSVWNILFPAEAHGLTPPSPHRLYTLFRLALARHYLLERRRERNYKQFGLHKLHSRGISVETMDVATCAS
jgi:glucosyl-dolichyl phosphate glucuronosyltransferase